MSTICKEGSLERSFDAHEEGTESWEIKLYTFLYETTLKCIILATLIIVARKATSHQRKLFIIVHYESCLECCHEFSL